MKSLAWALERVEQYRSEKALMPYQEAMIAMADEIERLNNKKAGAMERLNTARLHALRREMLSAAGAYTAREICGQETLFSVRLDHERHYPKFQFDAQRRAIPEMKLILAALSPDPNGWDRLQWFLTPHELLNRRTPLEVWSADKQKVVEAAQSERWAGRD